MALSSSESAEDEREKKLFREGESKTELTVPPGVSRTKRRKIGKEASQRQGQTSCSNSRIRASIVCKADAIGY